MAAGSVLHMVIVGAEDVPLFEADLSTKSTDASGREVRHRRSLVSVFYAPLVTTQMLCSQRATVGYDVAGTTQLAVSAALLCCMQPSPPVRCIPPLWLPRYFWLVLPAGAAPVPVPLCATCRAGCRGGAGVALQCDAPGSGGPIQQPAGRAGELFSVLVGVQRTATERPPAASTLP